MLNDKEMLSQVKNIKSHFPNEEVNYAISELREKGFLKEIDDSILAGNDKGSR